jgi:hypothetical protein
MLRHATPAFPFAPKEEGKTPRTRLMKTKKKKKENSPNRILQDYPFLPMPSHHALSFSLRCGIPSLISVSLSSKLALLALLLALFSGTCTLLLLPRPSAGNVERGENVSRRLALRPPGLIMPPGLKGSPTALNGRAARLLFLVLAVAGGRLYNSYVFRSLRASSRSSRQSGASGRTRTPSASRDFIFQKISASPVETLAMSGP